MRQEIDPQPADEVPAARPNGDRRGVVDIALGINDYDHTRELSVEGVALTTLHYEVEEIFWRFTRYREWDVSELSLAKYCSLRAAGDDSVVAIPVFPSRIFRHSAIYVRADGPIDDAAALSGARIGVPEWTQTATVYARGLLQDEYGVDLSSVDWVQAGTNEPGRVEGVDITVPEGIKVRPEPERSLNEMLLGGELDAVIAAHPPTAFKQQTGQIVRLFSDSRAVEEESFRRTGVFPIMHLIVLRADVHRRHPWLAMNLLTAFERAKVRAVGRLFDRNVSRGPLPWGASHAEEVTALMGGDPWPYGIEPNRVTLDALLRWAYEQGVCARRLSVDELFVDEVRTRARI